MKLKFCLLVILSLPIFLSAQDISRDFSYIEDRDMMQSLDSLELEYALQPMVNYEVGTSVFTNFDGMYGFNTYVAPKMVFQPSKKWVIDGGVFIGRTQMYNVPVFPMYGSATNMDQTVISMGGYARGTYLVNEKLYMGGTGFVSYNSVDSSIPDSRRNAYNNISGETFIGYKFSDHFKVEAGFRVGNTSPNNSFNPVPR